MFWVNIRKFPMFHSPFQYPVATDHALSWLEYLQSIIKIFVVVVLQQTMGFLSACWQLMFLWMVTFWLHMEPLISTCSCINISREAPTWYSATSWGLLCSNMRKGLPLRNVFPSEVWLALSLFAFWCQLETYWFCSGIPRMLVYRPGTKMWLLVV